MIVIYVTEFTVLLLIVDCMLHSMQHPLVLAKFYMTLAQLTGDFLRSDYSEGNQKY